MLFKNFSLSSLPLAISESCISQSAVVLADLKVSATIVTRLIPLCVAIKFFLSLSIKPLKIKFSIIPARVAGVPSPFLFYLNAFF